MNTITLREFRETGTKYKKLRKRLDKKIKTGSFYQLTKSKQRSLVYRVRKLYEKLLRLKNLLKLATAGATMSLILASGTADAQKIPRKGLFKQEFKSPSNGVKAYESDIFMQMTGSDNPFAGTNPFEGNIISYANSAAYADIDNDGDLDVFSTYQNNGIYTIKYYKNTGNNTHAILEEQYGPNNPADGIFFGDTPYMSFVDIDNDGDLDVFLTDQNNNNFFFAKNVGNATNPYFVQKTGSDNPLNGINPMYMRKLGFADIDNDGDLDVFINTYNNNPYLYRNTGDAENPTFTPEDASSLFDVTFNSSLNNMLLKDLDGDNDFDALINGNRYYENQGNNTNPYFVEITGSSNPFDNIDNYIPIPDLIDLDADSDLDLLFGSYSGIEYYKNTGTLNSAIFENTSGGIDSTYYAMPDFVDIDNDGDFDMFVGIYNETAGAFKYAYYKNTGTAETPAFEKQAWADNPLNAVESPSFIPVLKFVDIDNDGDQDVFTGGYTSPFRYFENTGSADNAAYTEQTGVDNPLDALSSSYYILDYDFVDIDNDGDLDFFFGDVQTPGLIFYRNTGSASAPAFSEETSPVTLPDTWYYLLPEFSDVDNDGDYDLFAGGVDVEIGQWEVLYAENKGSADTPDFEAQYGNANPLNLTMYLPGIAFTDIDNDGDEDAFIGTYPGTIYYFKNKTISAGINTVENENALSVYPNPATEEINVDLSSFNNSQVDLTIIDITGKTVTAFNMKDNNTIDVSNLKSGVYFIKVSDMKHSETAKLIIK